MSSTESSPKLRMSDASLDALVRSFYGKIRADPELCPIFERHVGSSSDAWEPHLRRMVAFWQTMLLQKPLYRGNPLARHRAIHDIQPAHFDRWLELFEEAAREHFDSYTATYVVGRARKMREHLSKNLFEPEEAP